MYTLSQLRTQLSNRLAETGTTFWSDTERDALLNEAQRFIAAITRGVPSITSGSVDSGTPYLSIPDGALDQYPIGNYIDGVGVLNVVPVNALNLVDPSWRERSGTPRWIAMDTANLRAYVVPAPTTEQTLNLTMAVLPSDMSDDSDAAFDDHSPMEAFQGPLVTYAAGLALLKERYDQDAERFFALARQELMDLGVNPAEIPDTPGGQ